jgi:hypothetical protein
MQKTRILAALAVCAGLAACGETMGEQAAIGAGAGALTAIAVDGNPVTGAVIGGAANTLYCQQNPGKCKS